MSDPPRFHYMMNDKGDYVIFHGGEEPIDPQRLCVLLEEFLAIVQGYGKALHFKRSLDKAEFGMSFKMLFDKVGRALNDIEPQYDALPEWAKWSKRGQA